jgi:monoamine oxidase
MTKLRTVYGEIPEPTEIVLSNWNSNPLTYGAWSEIPVGWTEEDQDILSRNEGPIYFAGEHTSRYQS